MSFNNFRQADAPPSRSANPFATCWTNPRAVPFHFADGQSAEGLVTKLAAQHWRGAILGPHGSGKSTLLEALKPALRAAGRTVHAVALYNGQHRLPRELINACTSAPNSVTIIDGYEQLAWPARLNLWLRSRRSKSGLLVSSHRPLRIPTLIQLAPTSALIEQLVTELCASMPTAITRTDIAASYACHGSNVREVFFDLYDLFESRRRPANRSPAAT